MLSVDWARTGVFYNSLPEEEHICATYKKQSFPGTAKPFSFNDQGYCILAGKILLYQGWAQLPKIKSTTMELSGFDYILFSQKSLFDIQEIIILEIKKIWPECLIDIEDEGDEMLWLFFTKNQYMHDEEDHAYDLDETGEGSFSIIADKLSGFNATVSRLNEKRQVQSEIKMILKDLWSYTLVLSAHIDENPFSKKIYDIVVNLLSENVIIPRKEYGNDILPYPVQEFINPG